MLAKRRPPLVAVLALSVTALLGRTLWVAGPNLIDTFGAVPPVPAAAGGGRSDGSRLSGDAVAVTQRPPGVGPTLPRRRARPAARVWDAAPPASAPQPTLRRLAQSLQEPSPPEVDLAYFVQVSAANVALLPRLMAAIYHPDNAYAVHFDVKVEAAVVADTLDKVGSALAALATEGAPSERQQGNSIKAQRTKVTLPENVLVMDRTPVTYRGITTVLNTLEGMSALLGYTRPAADRLSRAVADAERPPWTYFINLSASDYPLLSATATRRLLGRPDVAARQANFITLHPRTQWATATRNRYRRLVVDSGVGVLGATNTDPHLPAVATAVHPTSVVHPLWAKGGARPSTTDAAPPALLAKGGAWMIITRPFVTYATSSSDARRVLVAMANGLSSSEHFFPTLLLQPSWRDSVLPHALRAVYWDPDRTHGAAAGIMQHPNTIDLVVPDERAATRAAISDGEGVRGGASDGDGDDDMPPPSAGPFGARVAGSPYLFARKFSRPDAPLLDWIDAHRLGQGRRGEGSAQAATAEARAGTHVEWLLRQPPQQAVGA